MPLEFRQSLTKLQAVEILLFDEGEKTMTTITKTQERIISWIWIVLTIWVFLLGHSELKKGNISDGIWLMTITIIGTIVIATMGLSRDLREIEESRKKDSNGTGKTVEPKDAPYSQPASQVEKR
jgi:hypothetical protein